MSVGSVMLSSILCPSNALWKMQLHIVPSWMHCTPIRNVIPIELNPWFRKKVMSSPKPMKIMTWTSWYIPYSPRERSELLKRCCMFHMRIFQEGGSRNFFRVTLKAFISIRIFFKPKFFWDPKCFATQIFATIWNPYFFETQIFSRLKNFQDKILMFHNFLGLKFSGTQSFWELNIFLQPQIF